ncbi:MAG TPA: CerR family C-terminal domain-containing protein [Armatimonadota bacterium]|jgi:AcrR family transcriptional regulator
MHIRKDGEATREKILQAACLVFGEKGFHQATHTEISRTAGVNSALINFHFGTKEGLYRAVWEYVDRDVERRYPIDGGVPASAPAAERLYGRVLSLLNRALDPQLNGFHGIRTMEIVHPTGMLDEAMTTRLRKFRTYTQSIIGELLGPASTARTLVLCEMSVISQCQVIMPPPPGQRKKCHHFVHADVEELARHITRFSLAGISAIREQSALGHVVQPVSLCEQASSV